MAVKSATVRVACKTSTGTQDITISGFGTPKAALFRWVQASVNNTARNGWSQGVGAADGTNQWWMTAVDEHGVTTTSSRRILDDADGCINILDESSQASIGKASFSAWITDGVRIDWSTNNPSTGWFLEVTLFGGTDLSVSCGTVAVNATLDGTFTITPGFQMNGGIFAWGREPFDGAGANTVEFSHGFASYDGTTLRQAALCYRSDNADVAADLKAILETDRCCGSRAQERFEITSVSSTQVTFTTRDQGSSAAREIGYLVMNTNRATSTQDFFVGAIGTKAGTTGNLAYTTPGFMPQSVHLIGSLLEADDTDENSDLAGTFAMGAFDGTNEYMQSGSGDHGAATTDNQSLSDTKAVNIPLHSGATGVQATFVSFDATGFTLNYSAVTANAKRMVFLALQAEPSVTITPTPASTIAGKVDPTTVLGSTTATPTPAGTIAGKVDPTVILGGITVAPTAVSSLAQTVNPTIIGGDITIVNPLTSAIGRVAGPTVVFGSILVTTTPAGAIASVVAPTVDQTLKLTPTPVGAIGGRANPTVILGSVIVQNRLSTTIARTVAPTVGIVTGIENRIDFDLEILQRADRGLKI